MCDACGRFVKGCSWVNGMRFCAKCYQETFGNTTSQYVDMLNKEMYELKIATLEEQVKMLEKALELAVIAMECCCGKEPEPEMCRECFEATLEDFKRRAKEIMKSE